MYIKQFLLNTNKMKNHAETLSKKYDLGNNENDFYNYLIDSLINGNRSQLRNLFNEMNKDSQKTFLIYFLDVKIGYHKSALNICISELLK